MDKSKHQCVKWEPLEQWAAQRSFDAFSPGLLVHPVFGELHLHEIPGKFVTDVDQVIHTTEKGRAIRSVSRSMITRFTQVTRDIRNDKQRGSRRGRGAKRTVP